MKKLIITLVAAMALIGAVYGAAAGLTVAGVDDLGSGSFTVVTTDADTSVTDVVWTIEATDVSLLNAAVVELTGVVGDEGNVCDVGLQVTDATNTFDGVLSVTIPGTPFIISTASFDLSSATPAAIVAASVAVDGVTITLACDE